MVTTSTIAALPITTPSMVREALSLSPASAHQAKRTLSSQRTMRAAVVSWERIVGQQIVTGVLGYHAQMGLPDELLEMRHFRAIGKKVAAACPCPYRYELTIVNKHLGSARCVG